MVRFQFSLRQLLVGVILAALLLLAVRVAIRTEGIAIALLVVAIGVAILAVTNLLLYGFLRSLGAVLGRDDEPDTDTVPGASTAELAPLDSAPHA